MLLKAAAENRHRDDDDHHHYHHHGGTTTITNVKYTFQAVGYGYGYELCNQIVFISFAIALMTWRGGRVENENSNKNKVSLLLRMKTKIVANFIFKGIESVLKYRTSIGCNNVLFSRHQIMKRRRRHHHHRHHHRHHKQRHYPTNQ
uniref:Uncharacterized protein n=1 Tax=Glossina pallidipes TaxID=7398 RepID=A0A1B0A4V7_GLOPL